MLYLHEPYNLKRGMWEKKVKPHGGLNWKNTQNS